MSETRQRLINCFQAVFPTLGAGEIPKATMVSVATWDSLAGASLLSVIEEEFAVQVAPEDFEHFVSFELILDYLEQRVRADAS